MTQKTQDDGNIQASIAPNINYVPRTFEGKILYFNKMYNLPINRVPGFYSIAYHEKEKNPKLTIRMAVLQRLDDFEKTLRDELTESDDIRIAMGQKESPIDVLTLMADWYGDIIIYCASEMTKYGLPVMDILNIIMASNFTKLDENGQPIYDATGKVLKGPAYQKPEPMIKAFLESLLVSRDDEEA